MKKSLAVLAGLTLVSSLAMGADLSSNATFKSKCSICHGANGEGKPALKTMPLKDAASKSEAEIVETITKGKPPRMPAFGGKLTDAQIKELAEAIKALK
jgi:mono/diheme cytochrome c family protein